MQESQNVDLKVIAIADSSPEATCDVVFVHGLQGDPIKTWLHDSSKPESSWPNLLAADLPSARVWALGYPAEQFGGENARAMSIEDRAKALLENLAAEGFGYQRLIFIAHSLGGLLVKQMLRAAAESADSRWHRIRDAVMGVVFLATPHAGSQLANVAKSLGKILGPSVATLDLEQYSAKLLDLREWFSEYSVRAAIETAAFSETRAANFKGVPIGIVVPKESAWPGGTAKTIPIDNVDHFQIARPETREATVYKYVVEKLKIWLDRDSDPTQVPLDRETHENDAEEITRFLFRTRRVPFFGRVDELSALNKFLEDESRFAWCAVTGPGGSGKSRLALEFCLQLSPKWRAGFLKDWTSAEFRHWIPNRPTVIIVDYVSARARDAGSIVRGLQERSASLRFPVRIVLLERQADASWVREFLGAGEDLQRSMRGQYSSFPLEVDARPKGPYDDVVHLRPLVVGPLSPEALWECMLWVFSRSGSQFASRAKDAGYKAMVLAQLLEIDPSRRPLFAAFLADAISAHPDKLEWNRNTLVENVLMREQEKFWTPNGVTEAELDALTLATLARGVDSDSEDLAAVVPDWNKFSIRRYAVASGVKSSEKLHPLEPDIVGELFVLDRFRGRAERRKAEAMRDSGWKLGPLEMSAFLSRAARDFPHHPALWYLGGEPRTPSLTERHIWLRTAAESLLPICADKALGADDRDRASSWCKAFWESYRELLALSNGDKSDRSTLFFALALNQLGYTLVTVFEQRDCAFSVFDEVVARFNAADDSALLEEVATAMVNKGVILELDRSKDAIAVYDEVVMRFDAVAEPALRKYVARALFGKGVASRLKSLEDEIAAYDEVVARFGASTEPALLEVVGQALINKAAALGRENPSERQIAVYDEVVARFDGSTEATPREQVAIAMVDKGVTLGRLELWKRAIAAFDDVVTRFAAAAEPVLREVVAEALFAKAGALSRLKRSKAEIAAYDEVVSRFGAAAEPAVREWVAKALMDKGVALQRKRPEDAIAVYEEVVARFGAAPETASLREAVCQALFKKGVTLGRLDSEKEEIAVYEDLVARFGTATEPELRHIVEIVQTLRDSYAGRRTKKKFARTFD